MSLRINFNWKQVLKWGAIIAFGVFFLIFFIRVATFEDSYYREKEGSERAEAATIAEDVLDEVVPTEEQVTEYTVAADRPRYLSIPKLGITNARVIAVGVKSNGELGTPNNIFDVGWYDASGKPGQGKVMVIDGHNGGKNVFGVFKRIALLCEKDDTSTRKIETGEERTCDGGAGDIVEIKRGDGEIFKYEVINNKTVSLDKADEYMKTAFKTPVPGKESVTLISCTGDWSDERKTYLSRQFTRAILVD